MQRKLYKTGIMAVVMGYMMLAYPNNVYKVYKKNKEMIHSKLQQHNKQQSMAYNRNKTDKMCVTKN